MNKLILRNIALQINDLTKNYNFHCDHLQVLLKSYETFNNKIIKKCNTGFRFIKLNKFYEFIVNLEFKISKKKKKILNYKKKIYNKKLLYKTYDKKNKIWKILYNKLIKMDYKKYNIISQSRYDEILHYYILRKNFL